MKDGKKYFFMKYDYNKNVDTPIIGMFDEFNEIEEEMIELIMDKTGNLKIYFCGNIKKTNSGGKPVMVGSFEESNKFFKFNLNNEYKEFCNKYKLLLDK